MTNQPPETHRSRRQIACTGIPAPSRPPSAGPSNAPTPGCGPGLREPFRRWSCC